MNRREFIKLLALGVVGQELDIDRLLWVPGQKTIFLPTQRQIDFFNSTIPLSLYGIPYHACYGDTGQWLGLSRVVGIDKELVELIQILEKDKNESN